MKDLVEKAIAATRESKHIEFKSSFDPTSAGDWCEITKDIVAMANSRGGVIVFGLDNSGQPIHSAIDKLIEIDPSEVINRLSKYVGATDLDFEIREVQKANVRLIAFVIGAVVVPIVFQRPGTYDDGRGKQKSAFSMGTIYFRHGAKSEPGRTEDL